MEKVYSFRITHQTNETRVLGGRASKPEYLYAVFDGMIDFEEYQKISNSHPSIKKLLNLATNIFKKQFKNLTRIEIINAKTNEIVDFIEL